MAMGRTVGAEVIYAGNDKFAAVVFKNHMLVN
jgi:hypothetical protein